MKVKRPDIYIPPLTEKN